MSTTTRRQFAGFAAAGSMLSAAAPRPGRVLGANDRINVAFIGAGMQFQSLM